MGRCSAQSREPAASGDIAQTTVVVVIKKKGLVSISSVATSFEPKTNELAVYYVGLNRKKKTTVS